MSIFERRPRLRWAVPAAIVGLAVGGSLGGTLGAAADSPLPPRTAAELLVDLQDPQVQPLSGTVVARADLGLPQLPGSSGMSADPLALIAGTNTLRVWYDGPQRARVALIAPASETAVIRNGRDVWLWSTDGPTVDHLVLPADADGYEAPEPGDLPSGFPTTPEEAAQLVLAALEPSTEVTTSGAATVAGRDAYELVLTPKQDGTLVERVVIAMDAQTRIPLRVSVDSTRTDDPAVEVGYSRIDYARPDASVFEFTPPEGATVTERVLPEPPAGGHGDAGEPIPDRDGGPTVVGTGWTTVVVGRVPADAVGGLVEQPDSEDARQLLGLLESIPRESGDWGSGRVLRGTLVSAVLADDGRFAVGAVTPELLFSALARQ